MKNFRRGLAWQKKMCSGMLEAATASGVTSVAEGCQHRLDWIALKQRFLDVKHEFVTDKPSWYLGKERMAASKTAPGEI